MGCGVENCIKSYQKCITAVIHFFGKVRPRHSCNEMDGLRVEYPDWSFLLRASNTEAKLRLIVDARSEELLESKEKELLDTLEELK